MKHRIKLLSILSLLVIGSTVFFVFAKRPADDKPETIIIKTYSIGKVHIFVYLGGDNIEKLATNKGDDITQATLDIIQKYNAEGYKVISSTESVSSGIVEVSDSYVLTLK